MNVSIERFRPVTNLAPYRLDVPGDARGSLAAAWLLFGIAALLLSGLFVILIVFSRTPGLAGLFPVEGFFHLAIVAHVDLSVLIWFAAVAAMFWILAARDGARGLLHAGLGLAAAGTALVVAAPFQPGQAIMSNYVPVLDNAGFLAGLALFAAGVVLVALRTMLRPLPVGTAAAPGGVLRFGIHTSALAMLLAAAALVWSFLAMPDFLQGPQYFETLFWGGGHLLQFVWTQLMGVAWLWLAGAASVRVPLSPRLVMFVLLAGVMPAFLAVFAYLAFDVGSPQQRSFFVWIMAAGGGLAAGPLGLALLAGWRRSAPAADTATRGLRVALGFSIALFGLGGMLGFFIEASNTIVPAHYHGCIVAITLAFMALALHLLPRFGFAPARPRLVLALPWVYGVGQVLHVAGLAISGGHGVQRKTALATQGLDGLAQTAGMAVMGAGGLVAIAGGVLFLVAVAGSLRRRRAPLAGIVSP